MKYGQTYKAALESSDFPPNWVSAAVSYRGLKKCIKQVQQELHDFGLDPDVLKQLNSSFGVHKTTDGQDDKQHDFIPELWVAVDGEGRFIHAGLTKSTKRYLRSRANSLSKSNPGSPKIPHLEEDAADKATNDTDPPLHIIDPDSHSEVTWKQIPLSTVTNFFDSLEPAVEGVLSIQNSEAAKLRSQIVELSATISEATTASDQLVKKKKRSRKSKQLSMSQMEMQTWRELFELYTETPIFFSTYEQDHGSRTYDTARAQLQTFSDRLLQSKLVDKFQSPVSRAAFDKFIALNLDILLVLRFEEMNAQAVRKILKKFDKRTSLPASKSYRPHSSGALVALNPAAGGPLSRSIAHDMCAEIASNILTVVPCIDDYLCPICTELAWRPVQLGCCNAVFCIRCIIVLQRKAERRCPMCREGSVMRADWSRIHEDTVEYMKKYFPAEVEEKQAANVLAAGIDQYGKHFYRKGCTVM